MKVPRQVLAALILSGAAFLLGCHSVKVCDQGGRLLCTAENSCLLILSFIPVASGDVESGREGEWVCWEDTTTIENNMRLVERAMEQYRAVGVSDVASYRTEEQVVIFLLKRSTLHTSVELIRDSAK